MTTLILKFKTSLRRLYQLARTSALPGHHGSIDPAEFSRLVMRGRPQDFEKLAKMLAAQPLAERSGLPSHSRFALRKAERAKPD
jgi:hypothetical protein